MTLCIIGSNGQLGKDMVEACRKNSNTVIGIDYPDIDITNSKKTHEILHTIHPSLIFNCSALTAVDECESHRDKAFAVNADGVHTIAQAAKSLHAVVVHFSTDYVFDGKNTVPYTEDDIPNPQTVYGKSKLKGEEYLQDTLDSFFIFRVAWLYGKYGTNFVTKIRALAEKMALTNEPLKVVNDQWGTPTYTQSVIQQVLSLIHTKNYGIYHCTNEGSCTWYDFACTIIKSYSIPVVVHSCSTQEFVRPAPRPAYSVLENAALKKMNAHQMIDWRSAFNQFLEESK